MVRNAAFMGMPLPLRSNGGLELAIGQNPRALSSGDQAKIFRERLEEIHPAVSISAYRRLKSIGGEVAYASALGRETQLWIASHPGETIRLSLRHFRQTFIPDPWQFGNGPVVNLRSFLADLSGMGGICGLFLALFQRRLLWPYIAIIVICPAIFMMPFQPISRYTYIYYPWLTFCAAYLIEQVAMWWIRYRGYSYRSI
jgi:hypothetical protein